MNWNKILNVTAKVLDAAIENENSKKGCSYLVRATGPFNSGMYLINNVQTVLPEKRKFDDVYHIILYTSTAEEVASALRGSKMRIDSINVISPTRLVITNSSSFDTISITKFEG